MPNVGDDQDERYEKSPLDPWGLLTEHEKAAAAILHAAAVKHQAEHGDLPRAERLPGDRLMPRPRRPLPESLTVQWDQLEVVPLRLAPLSSADVELEALLREEEDTSTVPEPDGPVRCSFTYVDGGEHDTRLSHIITASEQASRVGQLVCMQCAHAILSPSYQHHTIRPLHLDEVPNTIRMVACDDDGSIWDTRAWLSGVAGLVIAPERSDNASLFTVRHMRSGRMVVNMGPGFARIHNAYRSAAAIASLRDWRRPISNNRMITMRPEVDNALQHMVYDWRAEDRW